MSILTSTRTLLAGLAVAGLAIGGTTLAAQPADATTLKTWNRLAQCEAGGNWHIDTGNGYYGGLQFSRSTWRAHGGGGGNPARATKAKQISVGERVRSSQGWGAWPACARKLGLR
jgi:hypothetical protein